MMQIFYNKIKTLDVGPLDTVGDVKSKIQVGSFDAHLCCDLVSCQCFLCYNLLSSSVCLVAGEGWRPR